MPDYKELSRSAFSDRLLGTQNSRKLTSEFKMRRRLSGYSFEMLP